MQSIVVVGIQWGDEGKGKMIDLLSEKAQHIVRSQGGNNAGHTIMVGKEEYRFHLVPSGILYPHTLCYITGGTVIDPEVLLHEIQSLEQRGVEVSGRLFLSPYAHVIFPYHKELDKLIEKRREGSFIGTTGRGIGPCYTDRASRIGIRICELINKDIFEARLKSVLSWKNQELQLIFNQAPLDFTDLFEKYLEYGKRLKKYVFEAEEAIGIALNKKEPVLFEGAHGSFLDLVFGTYPYVTSSNTIAAGVCAGAGIGPTKIDHVLGVVKAYTTRVGNGPLPTALTKEEEANFLDHAAAREIGTTTGRKRRIGWFDAPLARCGVLLNGIDSLAVTKLDILDDLNEIKICVGYRLNGRKINAPPALVEDMEKVEPIYETLPGWKVPTKGILKVNDMPENAKKYLRRIEDLCEAPISIISIGPERESTLFLKKFFQ